MTAHRKFCLALLSLLLLLTACREARPAGEPAPTVAAEEVAALTFDIAGGAAGFCDQLRLSAAGRYVLQSCAGDPLSGTLREADRATLQAWQENLAGFSLTVEQQREQATGLSSTLAFNGQGSLPAPEAQQQLILEWANGLFLRLRPPPPPAPSEAQSPGLCPDLERPAVVIAAPEAPQRLTVVGLDSLARCEIVLEPPPAGPVVTAAGSLFYPVLDAEAQTLLVWQVTPAGSTQPLPFTEVAASIDDQVRLAVSPDGASLAWGHSRPDRQANPPRSTHDLWLAQVDGGSRLRLLNQLITPGLNTLEPVRFSLDQHSLFYALQPLGLAAGPLAYSGRYHSLYRLSGDGSAPRSILTCPAPEGLFCLNDLSPDGGSLVYGAPAGGQLTLLGTEGNPLGTLEPPASDFVGQARFAAGGELAFLSARLDPAGQPTALFLSRAAPPYSEPPQSQAVEPRIVALGEAVDGDRWVVQVADEPGRVSIALLATSGEMTPLAAGTAVGVLR